MESMGLVDRAFWKNKRVLVTGHTGFKGAWLSLWLTEMGANVIGVSNGVPTTPSLFQAIEWGEPLNSLEMDIRNGEELAQIVRMTSPEIIFHLAAQSLVRPSYSDPVSTFSTNIMGTVNLFEAARHAPSVKAVINVTSDKCYENHEGESAYREGDRFGGRDPYSCSKGCAELITSAYQRSFFMPGNFVPGNASHKVGLASVRAGNVIGGGDWSTDRLIPDCIRAFSKGESVVIRNPDSIRPWQHVLDALRGYLLVGQSLYRDPENHSEGYNFGPDYNDARTVAAILTEITERWNGTTSWKKDGSTNPHEATFLRLDSSFAQQKLSWRPLISLSHGLDLTVAWYKAFIGGEKMTALSRAQIKQIESLESA